MKPPAELKSYVDNLSGILHLIAGETQMLVKSFKSVNNYVRRIVGSAAQAQDADTMMQQSTILTQQLTMTIQPLAEELRRLLGEEDYAPGDPSKILEELIAIATQLEELFTSIVVEFTIGVNPENPVEVESKLKEFELSFPTTILSLLKLFKQNIAAHVDKLQRESPLPQIKNVKPKNYSVSPKASESSKSELVRSNSFKRNVKPTIADKIQKFEVFSAPLQHSPQEEREDGLTGALNAVSGNLNDVLSRKLGTPLSRVENNGRSQSGTKLNDLSSSASILNKQGSLDRMPHHSVKPDSVLIQLQSAQGNSNRRMSVQAEYMVSALQKKNFQLASVSSTGNLVTDESKQAAAEPKAYSGNLIKSQMDLNVGSVEGLQQSTAQNSKTTSKFELNKKDDAVFTSMNTFSESIAKEIVRMSVANQKDSPLAELSKAAYELGTEIDRQGKSELDAPPLPVKDRQSYYPKLDKSKKQEPKLNEPTTNIRQLNSKDGLNKLDTPKTKAVVKKDKYLNDYVPPTKDEDALFLEGLTISEAPEVILQALNGYQLLPGASPQTPYLKLDLSKPARLGRSNTEKVSNFTVVGMTQVISRNHLEFFCSVNMFYVQDIGSNSGTWLNGQRLSEAGVVSEKFPINTGDVIRIGADFKQSAKDEEVRDIRHKCIIIRVVTRLPSEQTGSGMLHFSTQAVANQTMTDLMPGLNKNETDFRISKTVQLLANEPISIQQVVRKSSLQDLAQASVEQSSNYQNTTARLDQPKEPALPASKYFLAYSASTLPFKIRRLAVHNPANAIDFGHSNLKADFESTEKLLGLIGPEIMSVNLSKWGSQNLRQKIVVHDLRIPFSLSDDSQVRRYGTALEIVKETGQDMISLIVLTGEPYSSQELAQAQHDRQSVRLPSFRKSSAFKLGTIDLNSPFKCQINMCFIPLPGYITDTILMDPGPTTCLGSIPPSRQTIYLGGAGFKLNKGFQTNNKPLSPVADRAPYDIVQGPIEESTFPSLVIVGELGNVSHVSRFGFPIAPDNVRGQSPVGSLHEVQVDKSKTVVVLKRPLPSRLQKLVAEIRGKQVVKKSVRETKWVVGLEVTEDLLWSELESAAQATRGKEMIPFESTITSDGIKWVYRKEWWSLVLLSSMIYASVKEQQSV